MLRPPVPSPVRGRWDALFSSLDHAPAVLLAVSGGPDSIALMLLAARWAEARGTDAPKLHVATVDHGLRPEAREEAEMVARTAQALGLPHTILTWEGPKPRTRIQERAREARYALLATQARTIGATHLLTAHHADDQAETVLLRLARGSGPGGLAGMRRESPLRPGLILTRPLLDLPKRDLIALCAEAGILPADDPSNRDPTYARARLRAQDAARGALGLDTPVLVRLAARLARAEDALEAEARRAFAKLAQDQSLAALEPLEPEILIRLLRMRIAESVPTPKAIRLDRLERLARALGEAVAARRPLSATLGGARVVLRADTRLLVTPEVRRRRGNAATGQTLANR